MGVKFLPIEPSSGGTVTIEDGGNVISVDDAGASLTVDGTVAVSSVAGTVAVTQSGVWDEVGINDSGNSITVDGAVTVSATNLDVRDLSAASDSVAIHGDVGIVDQLDLTNTNPLAVAIVDGDGTQITSFGGGTQYTEDAAAAANPVGTASILVRADTPAGVTSDDGDNVAQRGTDYGAAYVTLLDSGGNEVAVGGGTQYTEGDTDATITGTAILWEDGSDTLRAVSAAKPLPISDAGGTLTVDGTVAVTHAALTELAAAIDTELQVDVVSSALPSGASTLAEQQSQTTHLATIAGDTTDIEAAVELIDDTIFTAGTDTYTEATSKGQLALAVRRDADTTLVNTTNEFAPLQLDANGRLKVEAFSGETLPVSLSGVSTLTEQQTQTTALQLIDDIVYVDDTATHSTGTSKGALIMAAATPTDTAVNANDIGAVGMTVNRELFVSLTTAIPAGSANIGDVDILSIIPGTGATNLGKAEDAGHTSADVGVFALAVRNDTPNTALTNSDTEYIQISANKLGSIRVAALEDDLATAATKHVKKYYTNAGSVTDGIIWSPAAGARWFLTHLSINVSAACTVTIEDDVAAGDVVVYKAEFAANSGAVLTFPGVPMFSGEDAADLLVTTTAGNIYITAVGYEI